jgi:sporulation protein YlmC with PRC-barrel domain
VTDGRRRGDRSESRTLSLSEMLGWHVVHEDGRKLGRLTDLEFVPRRDCEVVAIVVGPSAFLSRLTEGETLNAPLKRRVENAERIIPWSAVTSVGERQIVVSDDGRSMREDAEQTAEGGAA